jgi:serine/threonine-protein kinase RsbW
MKGYLLIHLKRKIQNHPLEKKDPEPLTDLIDAKIGGLGIHIVRKLMDDICYERGQGKNKLTVKKFI